LGQGRFGTDRDGYKAMLAAGRAHPDRLWAVEGCNGIGRHVAQRLVAVGLMLGGITLLGIITAAIASWLIACVRDTETSTEERLTQRIDDLHEQMRELRSMVANLATPDLAVQPAPSGNDSPGRAR
jgi:hypothetical protein